jgi:RNA polymerase sigma factor (sigma-70 family)
VLYFARRLTAGSAEDLAQLALIRIARAVHRVEPERAYRYVVTVARNVLRTEYRRRAREEQWYIPLDVAVDLQCPSPLDIDADYGELARAVREVDLATLSPALREVVAGLLQGLSPTEIALQGRLSSITVRTRLLRARAVLRHRLWAYLDVTEAARR